MGKAIMELVRRAENELGWRAEAGPNGASIWRARAAAAVRTYWVTRLVRSVGDGRADTLREWKEAGRGNG
jgi:hypothetical protein